MFTYDNHASSVMGTHTCMQLVLLDLPKTPLLVTGLF